MFKCSRINSFQTIKISDFGSITLIKDTLLLNRFKKIKDSEVSINF